MCTYIVYYDDRKNVKPARKVVDAIELFKKRTGGKEPMNVSVCKEWGELDVNVPFDGNPPVAVRLNYIYVRMPE